MGLAIGSLTTSPRAMFGCGPSAVCIERKNRLRVGHDMSGRIDIDGEWFEPGLSHFAFPIYRQIEDIGSLRDRSQFDRVLVFNNVDYLSRITIE